MKRFSIASAVVAVALVALALNVIPVRCERCGHLLCTTNLCSAVSGGCGDMVDGCVDASPALQGPAAQAFASGTPVVEPPAEEATDQPG